MACTYGPRHFVRKPLGQLLPPLPGSLSEDGLKLQRLNVVRKVGLSEMALLSFAFGFEGRRLLNFHKCNIRRVIFLFYPG